MANTQQEEENSFIALLKWLLGLDEELEEENLNIEEVKKRYKEITGKSDLETISNLQDIKNLKDRKSEIVKDTKINEIPLQLFEDIKEMEDSIEKSIKDKEGEINKSQEKYNKAKEDYDDKVVAYDKNVNDNKQKIEDIKKNNNDIYNDATNVISDFILIRDNLDSRRIVESDLEGMKGENKFRINEGGGVPTYDLGEEEAKNYNKINDYLKIKDSAKSGEEINDEFFRRNNGFTNEQIKNYKEINGLDEDQKKLLDNYLNNREELQKALKEKQNLDNQVKPTLDELKQKMNEAENNIKQLNGEIDKLKEGLENKKNEIDNKISDKIIKEVGAENLSKVLLAKRAMELNPNIGAKNALDMAENYKTPFFASGKEKRAAKDMEKAKKEMDKRVNEGLCGNSDDFDKLRKNFNRKMAEMKREFPFKTEEEQRQISFLCKGVFDGYMLKVNNFKKNNNREPTEEEQYGIMKETFEDTVKKGIIIGDKREEYEKDVIKALAYKIDKDEKAYKESKRAYINATKQRAAYGAERIAKNNQKNKEKEAKQERRKTRIQAIKDIGGDIKDYFKKVGELRRANKRLKKCQKLTGSKYEDVGENLKTDSEAELSKKVDEAEEALKTAREKVTGQAWLKTFKNASETYNEKKGKLETKKEELSKNIDNKKIDDLSNNNMRRDARKIDVKNVKKDSKETATDVAKQLFDGIEGATKSNGNIKGNTNLPNVQVKNENWRKL